MQSLKQYDPTHRTETFSLPSNPQLFVHMCGADPRVDLSTTLVVMVHGFPELGFSWRYQWRTVSSLGYSVCSPDMRGYGNTWVPKDVRDYSQKEICQDLLHLLKALKREKAIFIGHDFGGYVIWTMGLHHQDVCLGLVAINTPLMIIPSSPQFLAAGGPVNFMKTKMTSKECGHLDYQAYFLDSGDDEVNENPLRTMNAYFRSQISGDAEKNKANMRLGMRTSRCREPRSATDPRPRGVLSVCPEVIPRDPLWSESEIQVYVDSFAKTGFPLGWYRAMDLKWKWDVEHGAERILVPCLMVTAEYDAVLSPESSAGMEKVIPDLERKHLICGHWTMIERKDELNSVLSEYLSRKFKSKRESKL